ncbi:sigma-70 family RNA polymerase sigma factor [Propionibacteriaceae bacterium Y1700]|uniref:sigma-70 family RNA polymerase sigma factor n=1 Tax=Microlunatus sp. Y1700 TaxID=3418487 RepID=UPI003DA6E0BD
MTSQRVDSASALDGLAGQFAAHRRKLHAIAHRTLGSPWSADDAVQEVWLRLQRADAAMINNLEAWLTTVVSRVCIDMIRQQVSRREDLDRDSTVEAETADSSVDSDPMETMMRSDDLAFALQVVLDSLGPLERLALVLHDVFALSYDDISPIVERTPVAARQLASRARARLRTVDVGAIRARHETAISAFLDAARKGDFGQLLQLLDPEIELRSDTVAVEIATAGAEYGAPLLARNIRGADAVARVFAGRAELTRPVLIDGIPAAAYITDETTHAVYLITFDADRITRLDVFADPEHLAAL